MPAHRGGMLQYLHAVQVLLNGFAGHAATLTKRLKDASEDLARRTMRPITYLDQTAINKEGKARAIARADGVTQGLICARPRSSRACYMIEGRVSVDPPAAVPRHDARRRTIRRATDSPTRLRTSVAKVAGSGTLVAR